MFNKLCALALAAMLAAACAQTNTGGDANSPTVAQASSELVYFDSDVFDLQLSRSIRANLPMVTVKPPTGMTINDIPQRLNAWLVAVQRQGGKVSLVAVKKTADGKQEEFIQMLLPIALDLIASYVRTRLSGSSGGSEIKDRVADFVEKDPLFFGVNNVVVTIRYADKNNIVENITFQKI